MGLYDSFAILVDTVGWNPDTVFLIVGFFLAVYWAITIACWGLFTALFLKVLRWLISRIRNRRPRN